MNARCLSCALLFPMSPLFGATDPSRSVLSSFQQELQQAPLHLTLARIRGDGHCLFRAIAASLVLSAAWGGRQVRGPIAAIMFT